MTRSRPLDEKDIQRKTVMTSSDDFIFCELFLRKVSRTFAVNIGVLRGPVYRGVLIAYLLCRMADTIEDDPEMTPSLKTEKLRQYASMFPPSRNFENDYVDFLDELPFREDEDESILLHSGSRVFREFVKLPPSLVKIVSTHVREMAEGMARFQDRVANDGASFLQDEEDLRKYCYFVAGTVGVMLTGIFTGHTSRITPAARRILENKSVAFGQGLQITNIARDVFGDQARGWCYIPQSFFPESTHFPMDLSAPGNRDALVRAHRRLVRLAADCLDDALEYTLALPRSLYRFRLFCLWPLFMAVESLEKVSGDGDFFTGRPVKITRSDVKRIVRNTSLAVFSNHALRKMYGNARKRVFTAPPL